MEAKQQKAFLKALEGMVEEKGISKEIVVDAISEAFKIAYNKKLSDELLVVSKPTKVKKIKRLDENGNEIESAKLEDALIRCDIDLKKGKIETFRQFRVVKDADLVDDFVEMSDKDEKVKEKGLKVGDFYEEELDFATFTKGDVNRFISAYKQKISRAEKESLLELFKGKIGELVTGQVEKCDESGVIVNLEKRISVTLYQKDLIGKETFKVGDNVKVYIQGIAKDEAKGSSLVKVSRSCKEFLEKLFYNEVNEIYTGVVKIHDIARRAGVRSKVAVYSDDPNIDASGACIGLNGHRIQAVVSQLGNDKNAAEKIDVIEYNPHLGIFLRECLKPGKVIGVAYEETNEGKTAIVVCEDGTGSAAIGFKGTNVVLTRDITKLADIKVVDESIAIEKGLIYKTMEECEEEAREIQKELYRERYIRENGELLEKVPNTVETSIDTSEFSNKDEEEIEETVEEIEVVKEEPVAETPVETKVDEKPAKEEVTYEFHEVKTTTKLDELEASLAKDMANDKNSKGKSSKPSKKKKVEEKAEDEYKPIIDTQNQTNMAIYTDEENQAYDEEQEEYEEYEDEEDYSEYDSDSYYDDN